MQQQTESHSRPLTDEERSTLLKAMKEISILSGVHITWYIHQKGPRSQELDSVNPNWSSIPVDEDAGDKKFMFNMTSLDVKLTECCFGSSPAPTHFSLSLGCEESALLMSLKSSLKIRVNAIVDYVRRERRWQGVKADAPMSLLLIVELSLDVLRAERTSPHTLDRVRIPVKLRVANAMRFSMVNRKEKPGENLELNASLDDAVESMAGLPTKLVYELSARKSLAPYIETLREKVLELNPVIEEMRLRFTSGNDVPVTRAMIRKEEWDKIRSILEDIGDGVVKKKVEEETQSSEQEDGMQPWD